MIYDIMSLRGILDRLPWFCKLTAAHQQQMEIEVQRLSSTETFKSAYLEVLLTWEQIAKQDSEQSSFMELKRGEEI